MFSIFEKKVSSNCHKLFSSPLQAPAWPFPTSLSSRRSKDFGPLLPVTSSSCHPTWRCRLATSWPGSNCHLSELSVTDNWVSTGAEIRVQILVHSCVNDEKYMGVVCVYAVGSLERYVSWVNCLPDVRIATSWAITIVLCSMSLVICERNVIWPRAP